MRKRGITSLVATMLVLFGPAPMSLCAAMAGLPADCVPTPHCANLGDDAQPIEQATAPGDECCTVSGAPLPEAQVKAPASFVSLEAIATPKVPIQPAEANYTSETPRARSAAFDLQAVLCVFLI